MNHKLQFESEKSTQIILRETKTYFQNQGFKLTVEEDNYLYFERGSTSGNMIAFDPLKWKSKIHIDFERDSIIADFDIDTTYQMVTEKEKRVWAAFVSNYQKTIETGESFIEENQHKAAQTKQLAIKHFKYAVLMLFLCAIPASIFGYWTGEVRTAITMTFAGGLLLTLRKIKQDDV